MMRVGVLLVVAALSGGGVHGEEFETSSSEQIRSAVQKTIPWLAKAAAGSSKHNQCFTCHNHGLPIMALSQAKQLNFDVDSDNLAAQMKHTLEHLERGEKRYLEGKGQGGQVLTAGYALWSLQAGGHEPNDTTSAVAGYLLKRQADQDHWRQSGKRPPTDGTDFTTTYVALRGLNHFCPDDLTDDRAKRYETVTSWLEDTEATDTEAAVFRLKSLHLLKSKKVKAAVKDLLKQQRDDGGWGQLTDMDSDAYATATVLVALLQEGDVKHDHPAIEAGRQYLLDSQLDDGTWHVVTRADGFQPYYESGFPHGEDQFISVAASSWAIIALMEMLDETTDDVKPAS